MIKRTEILASEIDNTMSIMLPIPSRVAGATMSVWCDVKRVERRHRSVTLWCANKVNGQTHIARFDNNDTVGVWVNSKPETLR